MDFSVADEVSWPTEEIPDDNYLWMRVHKIRVRNGEIRPSAFENKPTPTDGMSTDWDKYASPQDTRDRGNVPTDNAVIRLKVGDVRQIPDQTVVHTPDYISAKPNRSHTDVFGEKHEEVRVKLSRICKIVIPL
jgi:hypothetical protein